VRLKSITATNFKGHQKFHYDLAPVTLLHGDNFRGKSAVVEAVTLALLGYVPGVATKQNELFERLASGNPMSVTAKFDELHGVKDVCWTRQYEQVGGAVKHFGTEHVFPPIAGDVSKFLGLSGPAQTRFLFECAELGPEFSIPELSKLVRAKLKNVKLDPHNKEAEAAVDELAEFVASGDAQAEPQGWLSVLAENLRLRKNSAQATVDRMAKTGQGLAQVAQARPTAPQDAEARWEQAKRRKSEVGAECARLHAQLEAKREEWRKLDTAAKAGQAVGEQAEKLKAEREDAESKLAKWTHELPETDFRPALDYYEDIKVAEKARSRADTDWQLVKARISEAKAVEVTEVCPTCGHKRSAADVAKSKAALKKQLKALNLDLVIANEKHLKACAEAERLEKLRDGAVEREKHTRSLEEAIAGARQLIARIDNTLEAATQTDNFRQQAEKAKADGVALSSRVINAQSQLEAETELTRVAEESYKQLLADRADAKSKASAAKELRRARAEIEVAKQACAIVAELQGMLVEKGVGPLVARMNELAHPVLPAPLEFRDGELGSVNQGNFYSWRTFSGTQRAMAQAALCLVLASKAPMRLVVLDELGRLDKSRKRRLCEHLVDLCAMGRIDQAILVDTECDFSHRLLPQWFQALEVK